MPAGGARPRAGRKPARIDLVELEKLCAMQSTDEEIAAWFGVSPRTIERRRKSGPFREVMDRGKAKGRVSVRRTLFRLAQAGNPAANIFLAKNLLGYRDVNRNEHSGPDGGPIPMDHGLDLTQLSVEELEQMRALVEKAQRPGGG